MRRTEVRLKLSLCLGKSQKYRTGLLEVLRMSYVDNYGRFLSSMLGGTITGCSMYWTSKLKSKNHNQLRHSILARRD